MYNLSWIAFEIFGFLISDIPLQYLMENSFHLTKIKSLKTILLTPSEDKVSKTCPSPSSKNDSCPKNMNKPPSAKLH